MSPLANDCNFSDQGSRRPKSETVWQNFTLCCACATCFFFSLSFFFPALVRGKGKSKYLESGITGGRPMCVGGGGNGKVANVLRGRVLKFFWAWKENLLQTMAKLTPDAIPPDTYLLHYGSATAVVPIVFTLVYVLTSTRSTALRICSVPAPAGRSPPEQICRTSISGGCLSTTQLQLNWAHSRQEVTHRNKNITSNTDKYKYFYKSFRREHFVWLCL